MPAILKYISLKPSGIQQYIKVHQQVPSEIVDGIKSVGITKMDIFLHDNHAVMVLEYPDGLDIDTAMATLATLPGQAEWEQFVSQFQECNPEDSSDQKWHPMSQIFSLLTP